MTAPSHCNFRVLHTGKEKKEWQFVLFNDATRTHWFSYHWLLGIKHIVIVTYFFRLLFPISSKISFICTFPQTGQHFPLVDHTSGTMSWNQNQSRYPNIELISPCPIWIMPSTTLGSNKHRFSNKHRLFWLGRVLNCWLLYQFGHQVQLRSLNRLYISHTTYLQTGSRDLCRSNGVT